jgi:ATP-dependent DNA helicase RecG
LASGEIDIVIGTHVLFQNNVIYNKLGFIVIDEQHRFGVNQRLALQSKSETGNCDLLLMTATPIPRTLIQMQYGDIDRTALERIPGRKNIKTTIIPDSKIDNIIQRLKEIINLNNKIYWVCPQIEDTENNITSVITRYNYLNGIFKNNVSLAHGKMSIVTRSKEIDKFYNSETQILVATTVIEVGIDVPDANIIIIENANLFGLTQLHQLRGRVGRNSNESYCMLMYNENMSEISANRLNVIRNLNNGFEISEKDLQLRGSGDVIGVKQSGFIGFKIADTENIIKYQSYSKQLSDQLIEDIKINDLNKLKYKMLFELYEKTDFKLIIA